MLSVWYELKGESAQVQEGRRKQESEVSIRQLQQLMHIAADPLAHLAGLGQWPGRGSNSNCHCVSTFNS